MTEFAFQFTALASPLIAFAAAAFAAAKFVPALKVVTA